jgi:NAD(P)H-flavin reductase
MNWIVAKKRISGNALLLTFTSPEIAVSAKPGQYVTVKRTQDSEPKPYTIAETNCDKGTVSMLVTRRFAEHADYANLNMGDEVFSVEGPYGTGFEIGQWGTVLCVAEGYGIEPLYPIVKALRKAGNKVIAVLASTPDQADCLREEFQHLSTQLYTVTSERESGLNSGIVSGMEKAVHTEKIDRIISFGNAYTAKETCVFAHFRHKIPAMNILYSVGNGNCPYQGMFRISLSEKSDLVCVDGDNFNAYYQGFDKMIKRFECHHQAVKTENSLTKEEYNVLKQPK